MGGASTLLITRSVPGVSTTPLGATRSLHFGRPKPRLWPPLVFCAPPEIPAGECETFSLRKSEFWKTCFGKEKRILKLGEQNTRGPPCIFRPREAWTPHYLGSNVLDEGSPTPPPPTLLVGILSGSCMRVLPTLFLRVVPALRLSPGPYRASE